jgi:RNA polymerase sigma-70 factor (family 1)
MAKQKNIDDTRLIEGLHNNDKASFTSVFSKYYKDLVIFSFSFTKDRDAAEEIVQDIFLRLWENRHYLVIQTSLKSYLLKSVQNLSLDWLRHQKVKSGYTEDMLDHPLLYENETEHYVLHSELLEMITKSLEKIPEPYAQTFRMNRFELLNYREIASKLGVSVRTVEVRISKALSLLRKELKDFLILLLVFVIRRIMPF